MTEINLILFVGFERTRFIFGATDNFLPFGRINSYLIRIPHYLILDNYHPYLGGKRLIRQGGLRI